MGRILILLFICTQINVINVTLRIVRGIKRCLGIKINTFNVGQIMTDQRIYILGVLCGTKPDTKTAFMKINLVLLK